MPREILQKISAAEEKADGMINQASVKAKEISDNASNDAFHIRERAVIESETEYGKIVERYKKEALKEASILEEKAKKQIAEIKHNAESKIDQAVEYIVGRILSIDVNS